MQQSVSGIILLVTKFTEKSQFQYLKFAGNVTNRYVHFILLLKYIIDVAIISYIIWILFCTFLAFYDLPSFLIDYICIVKFRALFEISKKRGVGKMFFIF